MPLKMRRCGFTFSEQKPAKSSQIPVPFFSAEYVHHRTQGKNLKKQHCCHYGDLSK